MYTRRGDEERNMYINEYLEKIKPYLIALINEKKTSSYKIQLDIAINLIHLTKSDRITFYVKSKNIVCLPSDDSEDILNQLTDSLLEYFNDKLMTCRTDSSYVFESIEGFSTHFHKIDLRKGSSYIPTPGWLEVKKATINPKNKNDNYCFAYATTIAIYHKEIGSHIDRISSKLLEYTYKLDWNGIDFPASTPDYKRFEKFNEDIALNTLYVPFNAEINKEITNKEIIDVRSEYISKFNFTRKIQEILLKISNGEKWHFIALKSEKEKDSEYMKPTKSFSRLMRDISSNSQENYYRFGCFHSFRCKSTLEKHTQLCKDHDFCKIKLPDDDNRIKEHKHGSKALRMNDIIYVDLECLLVNYDTYSNNPIKSHTTNIAQHIPSGYSVNTLRDHNKSSKVKYYRGDDCIQKLCNDLGDNATDLFETEKAKLRLLISEQKKKHSESVKCFICQKNFNTIKKSKYYTHFRKFKYHNYYTGIYIGAAHSICRLKYSTKRDIPLVIHNGSKYDFHFIIKELANEFGIEIHCIPEDKEQYKALSIPVFYKTTEEYEIPYNLRFIDSNKFMIGSLDNHINNLSELFVCNCLNKSAQQIKIKCDDKNIYTRCKSCTKRSKQSIDLLKSKFPNTYHLTKGNITKSILLLKKGVYPYEYMNDWNKFNETKLPAIDKFYSKLDLKNISKEDHRHAQNVWNTFNIRNIGEYHDLYVRSDTT